MKPQIPILALALLFPISSHAADQAAQTRAHYAAVNKALPKATVVKRELQGYSTEGGELTAYFQKGVPLKMVARYYGESGKATEEYYFWQGRLFFILRTSWHYEEPIGANSVKAPNLIRDKEQERWYFNNGTLRRWIRPNGKIVESGAEFQNQGENYLAIAREYLAGARGPLQVIGGR